MSDTLKEIRERVEALETREVHVLDGTEPDMLGRYQSVKLSDILAILDEYIAKESEKPAKPEPGDVGAWVDEWEKLLTRIAASYDSVMRGGDGPWAIEARNALAMRAAEVKRRIEEAGK